ncbi:MAG: aminotransferase class I/II-fold pyridoxal phosphate-dependent enzyme [Opitutales bacterium]
MMSANDKTPPPRGANNISETGGEYALATRCVRPSKMRESDLNSPLHPPIFQSAVFDLGTATDAEAVFSGERKTFAYTRFGNPSVEHLGNAIAALEKGAAGLVTSSGNAATLCAVTMALDGRSGPLVAHADIYGGSTELLNILSTVYRVPLRIVDSRSQQQWLEAVSDAGAVLLETPSNPLMRLIDLEKTVAAARASDAPVIVDNTVATPFDQLPFSFGADWIVHSTSKYLNGHSDMIGGCVVKREPLSAREKAIHKNLGGTVNALEAWLVARGMRTFALRMEAHNRNGRSVAEWLEKHSAVSRVHYPGLPSHPQHDLFQKQMTGGGALLSFELTGGEAASLRFIDHTELITHAVSLGGMETLAVRPAMSSHRGMSREDRAQAGIIDSLIRLSVGVEALDDILHDLSEALS